MDDVEHFLPLYLRFVKGVVDSADLPLNVSRELLQQDAKLDAMRSALTRRVIDLLGKMAKNDMQNYETFWQEFGQTLKEGVVEDRQNADRLLPLLRFATTHTESSQQDQSLADYVSRVAEGQDKIYYILGDTYATVKSSPHLEQLRKEGLEVLLLSDRIDPWMVEQLPEFDGKTFHDVGRGKLSLPNADGQMTQQAIDDEHKPLLKKVRKVLKSRVAKVNVSRRLVDSPACIVSDEQDLAPQLRRMLEASGQKLPESKPILEINIEHPLVARLSGETDEKRFDALSNIVLDHAMLAEGVQLDDPAAYVRRMNQFLLDTTQSADNA
jgi:molecular chaperone HtpG